MADMKILSMVDDTSLAIPIWAHDCSECYFVGNMIASTIHYDV